MFPKLRLLRCSRKVLVVPYDLPIYACPVDSCRKNPQDFYRFAALFCGGVLLLNAVEMKKEAILESVYPALEAVGGEMESVCFNEEGDVVEVRLLGVC